MALKRIAVCSTKGGVGKTTITAQLALSLIRRELKVGALDLDSSSPTLHLAFGLDKPPDWGLSTETEQIIPSKIANGIELVTMASHWGPDVRVSWRGTDKGNLTKQMLSGMVMWDPGMQYLCIDSPPSMSEEIFVLTEDKSISGYIIVTQPQPMSIADIERLTDFCKENALPVYGIVSNFDGCLSPNGEVFYPYLGGHIDVKAWAAEHKVPFICSISQSGDPTALAPFYGILANTVMTDTPVILPNRLMIKNLKRGALKIFMEDAKDADLDRAINSGSLEGTGQDRT